MRFAYTSLDAAALGGIAVIAGSIFLIASNYVWTAMHALTAVYPFFVLITPLIAGIWFIGGTASAYLIRKPGSAFAGEFLSAFVELLLAPVFGFDVLIWGTSHGLSSELGFALRKYKKWDYTTMMLAGALPGIFLLIPTWIRYPQLILGVLNYAGYLGFLVYILFHMLSGLIIAGLLTKYFIDRIALSGVLDLFEVGKEVKKLRKV